MGRNLAGGKRLLHLPEDPASLRGIRPALQHGPRSRLGGSLVSGRKQPVELLLRGAAGLPAEGLDLPLEVSEPRVGRIGAGSVADVGCRPGQVTRRDRELRENGVCAETAADPSRPLRSLVARAASPARAWARATRARAPGSAASSGRRPPASSSASSIIRSCSTRSTRSSRAASAPPPASRAWRSRRSASS